MPPLRQRGTPHSEGDQGDKTLETEEEVRRVLDDFFASIDINFYQRGIHCLVQKWKDVTEEKGNYLL